MFYGRGYFVKFKIIFRKILLWLFIFQRFIHNSFTNLSRINFSKLLSLKQFKNVFSLPTGSYKKLKNLPLRKRTSDLNFASLKKLTTRTQSKKLLPTKLPSLLTEDDWTYINNFPNFLAKIENKQKLNYLEKSGQFYSKWISLKSRTIFWKLFVFQIIVCVILIIVLVIGLTNFWNKNRTFRALNRKTTVNQLLTASEKFLHQANNAPGVFGDVTLPTNIWFVTKSTITNYTISQSSNVPGVPWIFNLSYFYMSNNLLMSPLIQQIYLLHVSVKVVPFFDGKVLKTKINIYKSWTIDYHYFVIPNFKCVFYKTTDRYLYYYGGYHWNPYWNPQVRYNNWDYFFVNYYILWRFTCASFDLNKFKAKPITFWVNSPMIDSSDYNYKTLHFSYKNPDNINLIIGAFKGPNNAPMSIDQIQYSVNYKDFAINPTIGPAPNSQKHNKNFSHLANWSKTITTYKAPRIGTEGWSDVTPKLYSWTVDPNTMFIDEFNPAIFQLIQNVRIENNLKINTCFQDAFNLNYRLKKYTANTPNRTNSWLSIYQDVLDWKFVGDSIDNTITDYSLRYVNAY